MSTPIMHRKPCELTSNEERGKYTVSIIGCGQNGIFHAVHFAGAGFRTICIDPDQAVTNLLARGKTSFSSRTTEFKLKEFMKSSRLAISNNIKSAVSCSDIVIVTVPTPIDDKRNVDFARLEDLYRKIGGALRKHSLVIVATAVGVGTTERLIKETLEGASGFKVGADLGLVYSPTKSWIEGRASSSRNRIIASSDDGSLDSAADILAMTTAENMIKTHNVRAAELAVLAEMAATEIDGAFVSELEFFCEKAGIDYFEMRKIAGTTTDQLFAWTLPERDHPEELNILLENSENLNFRLRLPEVAKEINDEIAKHVMSLVQDALKSSGKTLRRARISLLGISQVQNSKAPPKRVVRKLAELLEKRGARLAIHDPYFSVDEVGWTKGKFKKSLNEVLEASDCIVILTGHDQFKRLSLKRLGVVMKKTASIVDLEAVVEADKVEKLGFIYRGLGRGVWTK